MAKSGRPQIQIFRSLNSFLCPKKRKKTTFDSTTNHLNQSPMFMNCLLLVTIIDIMSIVHMEKIWVKNAKNFEMRTSGGRLVFKDFGHPRTRGRGSKKGKFLRTSFMDGPLPVSFIRRLC